MARMIPSEVYGPSTPPGEITVFESLRDDPETKDWVVLHSLDIVHHRSQISGEIDFVVIIPSKGVLIVEVKSHSFIDRRDGLWFMGRGDRSGSPRGPFKQVSSAMHSLQNTVVRRMPGLKSVPFATCVIFTNCEFKQESTEWHDWEIIDSAKLTRPIGVLLLGVIENWRAKFASASSGGWFNRDAANPIPEQVDVLTDFLRPSFEVYESPKSQANRRAEDLKRYTESQYRAIDSMSLNRRVIFQGPAGTGKTMLAIEAARRAAANGRRVLFICFNNLLGEWLRKETEPLAPLIETTTLHKYLLKVAAVQDVPASPRPKFWNEELPAKALEALVERGGEEGGYDELVIDEAQDILRPNYLDILDLTVKDGLKRGRWRIFGDFEKQSIYKSDVSLTLEEVTDSRLPGAIVFSLRENCRNRPRVAEMVHLLGGLTPGYSQILRPDDGQQPKIKYYSSLSQQLEILTTELADLYRDGFDPGDIVILSPKGASECAAGKVSTSPWKERLRPISSASEKQIRYSSIHAFKGLEAGAIIVTDIEDIIDASDLFYVAVTRTLHRLILLISDHAKQDVITTLLGQSTS
ncbi:MAG: nuclease [Acidobacteria bacterium]|nr:MAG: nuclease [Acidobacteriota bacterium]